MDIIFIKYLVLRFFSFFGRICMTFFPIYLNSLGFEKLHIGFLLTIFGGFYVFGSYFYRFISQMPYKGLVVCLIYFCSGAITWLLFYANFFWLQVFAVSVFGLSQSLIATDSNYLLVALKNHRTAATLSNISVNLGAGIAGVGASFLITYNYLYVILFSFISLLLSAIIYFNFSGKNQDIVKDVEPSVEKFKLKFDGFLMCCFLFFCVNIIFCQFYTLFPIYISDYYQASPKIFGSMSMLNALLIISCEFILVKIFSRYHDFLVLALGSLLICFGFGLLPFGHGEVYLYICFIIFAFGEMIFFPVSQFIPKAFCSDESKLRQYVSTYYTFYNIPVAFGPLFFSAVYQYLGGNFIWYISLGLAFTCAISYCFLYAHQKPVSSMVSLSEAQ